MHLSTEESPASWMVKLSGEIGGGVPEYFSGEVLVKSYREKTVLKSLQLEFRILLVRAKFQVWGLCHSDDSVESSCKR